MATGSSYRMAAQGFMVMKVVLDPLHCIYSTFDIQWSYRRKALPCLWLQSTFTPIISRLTLGQILLNKGGCSNHLSNILSHAPYPHAGFHSPGFAFEHQDDQWTATQTGQPSSFSQILSQSDCSNILQPNRLLSHFQHFTSPVIPESAPPESSQDFVETAASNQWGQNCGNCHNHLLDGSKKILEILNYEI